ncbi:MAG: hypothetical protein ACO2O1_04650 [Candidatus Caldarchaeales archaeon]
MKERKREMSIEKLVTAIAIMHNVIGLEKRRLYQFDNTDGVDQKLFVTLLPPEFRVGRSRAADRLVLNNNYNSMVHCLLQTLYSNVHNVSNEEVDQVPRCGDLLSS